MGIRLEDLPPSLRRQAETKLGERATPAVSTPAPAPTSPRAAPVDREHGEQAEFVRRIERDLPVMHGHMTAVPHGGLRTKATAGKLRAEGVRDGYPDLLFDLPRGPYHGLRIEMKSESGRTRPSQRGWRQRLSAAGYRAVVCWSADEAMTEARAYWELGPFRAMEECHG